MDERERYERVVRANVNVNRGSKEGVYSPSFVILCYTNMRHTQGTLRVHSTLGV